MSRLFGLENVVDSDDWYTPAWIFDGLGLTFDLDVASPDEPLPWVPAISRYTVSDDGLTQPWCGLVWCNPPYSSPAAWCRKWAEHGNGLILIRADLSTSGPLAAVNAATSVYVASKRIQFVNGAGARSGAVNFSTVLLGAGDVADMGIARLAARCGGVARSLVRAAA